MGNYSIAVLAGDGIVPEVTGQLSNASAVKGIIWEPHTLLNPPYADEIREAVAPLTVVRPPS